jgi:hypothetical protein
MQHAYMKLAMSKDGERYKSTTILFAVFAN